MHIEIMAGNSITRTHYVFSDNLNGVGNFKYSKLEFSNSPTRCEIRLDHAHTFHF